MAEALGGLILGYLLRKGLGVLVRALGLLVAALALALLWLESAGVVTVNWAALWSLLGSWLEGLAAALRELLEGRVSPALRDYLASGALGLGGLLVGWWVGGRL